MVHWPYRPAVRPSHSQHPELGSGSTHAQMLSGVFLGAAIFLNCPMKDGDRVSFIMYNMGARCFFDSACLRCSGSAATYMIRAEVLPFCPHRFEHHALARLSVPRGPSLESRRYDGCMINSRSGANRLRDRHEPKENLRGLRRGEHENLLVHDHGGLHESDHLLDPRAKAEIAHPRRLAPVQPELLHAGVELSIHTRSDVACLAVTPNGSPAGPRPEIKREEVQHFPPNQHRRQHQRR